MQAILERQNGTRSEVVPEPRRFSVASAGSDFPESATQAIRMPPLEPLAPVAGRPRQGVQERMHQEQMRLVASTSREERHRWWVYMKEALLFAAGGGLGVVAAMLLTQPSFLWTRSDELAVAEVSLMRALGMGLLGFVAIVLVSVAGRMQGWHMLWNGGQNVWLRA